MKKVLLFFLLITAFSYVTTSYSNENVNTEIKVIRKSIEVRPNYYKTYNYQIKTPKNQIVNDTINIKKLILFNEHINMNLVFNKEGLIYIRLYDMFGNIVQSEKLYVKAGFNELSIEMQDLRKKILYLTIEQDSNIVLSKLVLNY